MGTGRRCGARSGASLRSCPFSSVCFSHFAHMSRMRSGRRHGRERRSGFKLKAQILGPFFWLAEAELKWDPAIGLTSLVQLYCPVPPAILPTSVLRPW